MAIGIGGRGDGLAGIVDPQDAIDRAPGAGGRGIGPRPGIDHRQAQRFTLERRTIADLEPHPIDGRRAGLHDRIDDLADALDRVELDLDGVARHEAFQHAAAVREIELLLNGVAERADRVAGKAERRETLLHRRHAGGVLLLGLAWIAGAGLDRGHDKGLVGRLGAPRLHRWSRSMESVGAGSWARAGRADSSSAAAMTIWPEAAVDPVMYAHVSG